MNAHDYLIDHSSLDWNELLEEWDWLLPSKFSIWLLTRAGDLFIQRPDSSIMMLEVGGGELSLVADSSDDFYAKIDEPDQARDWLSIPVIDDMTNEGHVLDSGRCFSYRHLPVLGGSYGIENRVSLPIREHFGAWGSIHRQIKDLPDGARVIIQPTD
jgi:hypothetical protein